MQPASCNDDWPGRGAVTGGGCGVGRVSTIDRAQPYRPPPTGDLQQHWCASKGKAVPDRCSSRRLHSMQRRAAARRPPRAPTPPSHIFG
ncbi:hypothetical protein EVAR_14810_1 [Eumeta japonica]|uniref:Uncharacterized protein n=1 Tax=Eumeta variegata TaxID=151549 RepID=A0A4C1TWI1_EUMVA|nr:hypothetical protein EVAR_14810_1 [Eumeta japonica]